MYEFRVFRCCMFLSVRYVAELRALAEDLKVPTPPSLEGRTKELERTRL